MPEKKIKIRVATRNIDNATAAVHHAAQLAHVSTVDTQLYVLCCWRWWLNIYKTSITKESCGSGERREQAIRERRKIDELLFQTERMAYSQPAAWNYKLDCVSAINLSRVVRTAHQPAGPAHTHSHWTGPVVTYLPPPRHHHHHHQLGPGCHGNQSTTATHRRTTQYKLYDSGQG